MKKRVAAVVGAVALVAVAIFGFFAVQGNSGEGDGGGGGAAAHAAPASPAKEDAVGTISAEPDEGAESPLTLTAPESVDAGSAATFEATWETAEGEKIEGQVDLQQVQGNAWKTVAQIDVKNGAGKTDLPVEESGLYRLAYGGSAEVEKVNSPEVLVKAGDALLGSRLIATAHETEDGKIVVTAGWTTEGSVPISGEVELQEYRDNSWATAAKVTVKEDGTGTAEVEAGEVKKFRFVYLGGSRFEGAVSYEAVVVGDDVRTISVEPCSTNAEIDGLGKGVGCHYTPVKSGTFVVGHDYLDNAWWNSVSIGSHVKLSGEHAGLYEVVDREIAPARGAALGSASEWTCGDECDVILQTCQGKHTGFTWLRRVNEGDVPA